MLRKFTLLIVIAFITLNLNAQNGTCGENLTWRLGHDTLYIEGTGAMENYTASAGAPWYSYHYSIHAINIADGVTTISSFAFLGYINVRGNITIPGSVTNIGNRVFGGCHRLTSINVASNNPNYSSADGVLFNKDKTTIVAYPSGKTGAYVISNHVTSIEEGAFYYCIGLTNITIGNGITTISNMAFYHCDNLAGITIPNSVTSIGDNAFDNCYALTSITIPNSVTSIGNSSFFACLNLTNITVPDSITNVGNNAFGATAWYENQPDGVVYLGKILYEYKGTMPRNTSIIIRDSTFVIASWAFAGCTGLTNITFPSSLTSICINAFYQCAYLTNITFPGSVVRIDSGAFRSCSRLTNVTISASVENIGTSAFWNCYDIISFDVESNNPNYSSVDGILFDKNKTILIQYPASKQGKSYTIPKSVTTISGQAFSSNYRLTAIIIPRSVATIGEYAFAHCYNLVEIHNYATVPQSVRDGDFIDVNKQTCTLYVPVGSLESYRNADVWKDFKRIEEETPNAIKNLQTNSLFVYPNPVKNIVFIENANGQEVFIYNLAGKLLLHTHKNSIDLSGYPNGIYLLKSGDTIIKLVKL